MAKVYYGKEAVKKVEEKEGRKLSYAERRVVEEEGYVPEVYKDTKGITTYGVGQTGKYMGMSFDETFQDHLAQAKKLVPVFDTLPEEVQAELVQAAYRGDLGGSPNALKKLNAGDYEGFAQEFLNNKEYKDKKTSSGIKKRMEKVASTVASLSENPPTTAEPQGTNITEPIGLPDLKNKEDIKRVQQAIGVKADGIWGPQSQKAWKDTNDLFVTPTYREEGMQSVDTEESDLANPFFSVKRWFDSI